MSTPQHSSADAAAGDASHLPASNKKLRFDLDEPPLQQQQQQQLLQSQQQPKLRSALKSSNNAYPADSGCDSKEASPFSHSVGDLDGSEDVDHHHGVDSAASGATPKQQQQQQHHPRRTSESGDCLRVTLNTAPAEIIESASSPAMPIPPEVTQACLESEVAQLLADIGIDADGGKRSAPLREFRPLLARIAALLLAKKPANPERFLVDHFYSKSLSSSMVAPNARLPLGGDSCSNNSGSHEVSNATNCTAGEVDVEGRSASSASNVAGGGGIGAQPIVFAPVGDTLAQRLAFSSPMGVCRSLVERMASLLFAVKPSDPETFLWTKLDSRSFSEEVAAATTVAYTADGFPLLPPDDPTQAALLREIPPGSIGYNVAANIIPLLFAKKPDNPMNYLFLHFTSRARSSIAGSARSSNNRLRFGEEDNASCTSCDIEYDDDVEHDEMEDDDRNLSKDDLTAEQDAVLNTFLTNLQRRMSAGAVQVGSRGSASRRRSLHSTNSSTTGYGGAASHRRNSRTGAGSAGSARHVSTSHTPLCPGGENFIASVSNKHVCITGDQKPYVAGSRGGSPVHERPSAYYPYSTGSTATSVTGAGGGSADGFFPSFCASTSAVAPASPDHVSSTNGEMDRLREELNVMRLRGALRLERVAYEVDILRQEKEHLARLAAVDRGEHALRALHAAAQALSSAESHLQVLEAKQHYLLSEMMPRQLRTMAALTNQQQQQQLRTGSRGDGVGTTSTLCAAPGCSSALSKSPMLSSMEANHNAGLNSSVSGSPSELDILRKRVELLMMEQSRLRAMGEGGSSACV